MRDFEEILEGIKDTRNKVYYNLSELVKLTGMSSRALKYRMLTVKSKYKNNTFLLTKKSRQWQIHYDIIKEFYPKYNTKNRTIHTHNWVSTATWNTLYNYEPKYHIRVVEEIKKQLPNNYLAYVIELDGRDFYHTHLVSDAEPHDLNRAVSNILYKYIEKPKELKLEVASVINKYALVEYLKKAPIASGVI